MVHPMSIHYNPIPDVEDVNPVDISVARRHRRSFRMFLASFIIVIVTVLLIMWYLNADRSHRKLETEFTLYQTSQLSGDYFQQLDGKELNRRGFGTGLNIMNATSCWTKGTFGTTPECDSAEKKFSRFHINREKEFQNIIGFGGAFTEASAINYFKLSSEAQKRFIQLYFGEDGLGYSLGRVHINSCDFSISSYNFDNFTGDFDLMFFDQEVTHDKKQMIPLILAAMEASKRGMKLLASPWSPPAWMKQPINNRSHPSMLGSKEPNCLVDSKRVKAAWAKYFSKFIDAYASHGVNIWAITPQNEPEFAAPWEACAYTPEGEKDFIQNYLGPTLRQYHPQVLILAFDHNKDDLERWARILLDDSGGKTREDDDVLPAASFIDGWAFHWYAGGMERLLDGTIGYDVINRTHHLSKKKLLVSSEGCSCPGVRKGDLLRAERLGHDVLYDLLNWANGWIDWNLLLDSVGGPNHLGNYCDAAIISSYDGKDFNLQLKYYYMKHFSRFLAPGSRRVASEIVGNYKFQSVDPNVRWGQDVTLYPCEKSSRQMWELERNKRQRIILKSKSLDPERASGEPTELCLGRNEGSRKTLRILDCRSDEYQGAPLEPLILSFDFIPESGQLQEKRSGLCVRLANDVWEAGALLELSNCSVASLGTDVPQNERFIFVEESSELLSLVQYSKMGYTLPLCMTAGWPFLSAAAFVNPAGKVVAVVMNEADVGVDLVLHDKNAGALEYGIGPRSIQTVIY